VSYFKLAPKFLARRTAPPRSANLPESGSGSKSNYKAMQHIEPISATPSGHGKNAILITGGAIAKPILHMPSATVSANDQSPHVPPRQ